MASLTVRQLDERLKKQLRLRAARNGRSVEDEVRTHLARSRRERGDARAGRRQHAIRCRSHPLYGDGATLGACF